MNYSFSTVLMTILTSNLLIAMVVFCFRNREIMLSIGYKLVTVFLVLTMLRFLFPFEVSLSKNIYFPEWLSACVLFLRHIFFSVGIIQISIWFLLGCIWLGGTLYFFYRHYRRKAEYRRFIVRYGRNMNNQEPYKTMMAEICGKRRNPLWVVKAPYNGAPMQYGTFQPYIVLPENRKFTDEELYYILRHETAHYYHHDALIKDAVGFLRAIYWWNPLCGQMVKKTDILLEMRVDEKLIDGDEVTREAYCRTLDHISEMLRGEPSIPGAGAAISMASSKNEDLEYRRSMMYREKGKRGPWFYLLTAMVFAVYICSYCFTFEAYYIPSQDEVGNLGASAECFYAVPQEDGTYNIYLDGMYCDDVYYEDVFIENVDNLELYIDIPIREN